MMGRKRREVKNWEDMDLVDVKCIGGYRLRYRFKNGRVMECDIEKFAKAYPEQFKPMLDDPSFVGKKLKYTSGGVYWSDMMDMPCEFLYCVGTIVKEH